MGVAKASGAHHLHHCLFCLVPFHALELVASLLSGVRFFHFFRVCPWLAAKEASVSWVNAPFPVERRAYQRVSFPVRALGPEEEPMSGPGEVLCFCLLMEQAALLFYGSYFC